MQILLNGDRRELPGPVTVRALLETLSIDARVVAVELNRTVIRRHDHERTLVGDGAEVEIVSFVGGGAPKSPRRRWAVGLLVAATCFLTQGPSGAGAHQTVQTPKPVVLTDETLVVYNGWARLAAGDIDAAVSYAQAVLAKYPRNIAAISLLMEAEIVRGGGFAGLGAYERWLGARKLEDGYLLRRAARATLWDATESLEVGVEALQDLAADDDPEALTRLLRHMLDGSAGDTWALARLGREDAIRKLIDQVEKTPGGKMYQIQVLIDSRSPLVIPTLTKLLDDKQHPDHMGAAANGLGILGAKSAIPALRRIYQETENAPGMFTVRISTAAGLYMMGDPMGLPFLQKQLTSDSPFLRLGAARMMAARPGGVQPDALWLRVVRELAQNPDPTIRVHALGLIAPYDLEMARQSLERLVSDENAVVRDEASKLMIDQVASDFTMLRRFLHSPGALTRVQAADRILKLTR